MAIRIACYGNFIFFSFLFFSFLFFSIIFFSFLLLFFSVLFFSVLFCSSLLFSLLSFFVLQLFNRDYLQNDSHLLRMSAKQALDKWNNLPTKDQNKQSFRILFTCIQQLMTGGSMASIFSLTTSGIVRSLQQ